MNICVTTGAVNCHSGLLQSCVWSRILYLKHTCFLEFQRLLKYKRRNCFWCPSVLLFSSLVTYCSERINSLRTGPKPEVLPSTGYTFLANWLPKNSSFLAVVCFIRSVYHYFLIFSRFADTDGYRQTALQEPWPPIYTSWGSFGYKYRHSRHTFIISDHVLIGVILNSARGLL